MAQLGGGGPSRGIANRSARTVLKSRRINRAPGGVVDNPEVEYFLKTIYPSRYTIVDPGETWEMVGADGVDTNEGDQGPCSYVYRPINPVSGDFTLRFKFQRKNATTNSHLFWVGLSEGLNCWNAGAIAGLDMCYVRSNQTNLAVGGMVDGVNDISGNLGIDDDTDYWCELKRVGAQMQLRVYNDSGFTDLRGTLNNTLSSIDIMNYIMIAINYGTGSGNVVDILTEEISFN